MTTKNLAIIFSPSLDMSATVVEQLIIHAPSLIASNQDKTDSIRLRVPQRNRSSSVSRKTPPPKPERPSTPFVVIRGEWELIKTEKGDLLVNHFTRETKWNSE
eukprot:TRINITY_DN16896_c0_g1_i1.p1 TRINITY_DN16896_c0_g1~~TRINITY_DN16896_c0_g1_i1.p1  ORF type:complete len:103 (-),score=19.86 TRINITY_DN16896_c0_g1_i1:4-312(-)